MKPLMLSGAVPLAASGAPMAQTPAPDAAPIPAFQASDFTGKTLYILSPDVVTQLRGTATYDECTTRWTSGETFIAGRKRWDDIGAINDPIMTRDGQLHGVLLDIGGFLGIGARTVMVDMADLYFVAASTTPDDLDNLFAIASLSREQLEALPEWREENLAMGYPAGSDAMPATDGAGALPTAEELTGAEVQDATGASIGTIGDLLLEGDRLAGARIDVAGFLGLGTQDVILPVAAPSVTRKADGGVDHVQTSLILASSWKPCLCRTDPTAWRPARHAPPGARRLDVKRTGP